VERTILRTRNSRAVIEPLEEGVGHVPRCHAACFGSEPG
jgi:hypothetical protein